MLNIFLLYSIPKYNEKSLNFILNVAGNLKLKFGAIRMKSVKSP